MPDFPLARIDFAAKFAAPEMSMVVLGIRRGAETVMRLHIEPHLVFGSDLHMWANGGWDSGSNRYRHRGWNGIGDPWSVCTYWGPPLGGAVTAARFCGNCGTARLPGGRFCGSCGSPFVEDSGGLEEIRSSIERVRQYPTGSGGVLRDLITAHCLGELQPSDQTALADKVAEAFASVSSLTYTDGQPTSDRSRLTLASAQDLALKVTEGATLDDQDLRLAEQLLEDAPLHFGWWGPFKAVLKRVDPGLMPQAFGRGLGRLHKPLPMTASVAGSVEDISFLSSVFTNPTRGTANYMRRRARRDLARLALAQPDAYTSVVTSMLHEWDSTLSPTSYAPAFAMLGGQEYLTQRSRVVDTRADQSVPRFPHPEAWVRFPEGARDLANGIRTSVESFTFARQILDQAGVEAPPLSGQTLPLALRSTDPSLVREGHLRLADESSCWESLPLDVWSGFLRSADDANVSAVVTGLLAREPISNVTWAASAFLSSLLRDGVEEFSDTRLESVARLYLAYTGPSSGGGYRWSREADVAAVFILGMAHDLSMTPEAWQTVLSPIPVDDLIAALDLLHEQGSAPGGSTALIIDLIVQPAPDWQLEQRITSCLAFGSQPMRDVAWRLAAQLAEPASVLGRIASWIRQSELGTDQRAAALQELLQRVPSDGVSDLLASIVNDGEWGFDHEQVADLISGSREAAALLWQGLESTDPSVLMQLIGSDRRVLLMLGDSLSSTSTAQMTDHQRRVISDYLRTGSDRLAREPEFIVALACRPYPEIQDLAIGQLAAAGLIAEHWLSLAECGLPIPQQAAFGYVEGIRDHSSLTEAVLVAIDSPEPSVRDFGLLMLDRERDEIDLPTIWAALVHTDDPIVQARVVEESMVREWDDEALSQFDRRLLVTRRGSRKSKEQIKSRLEAQGVSAMSPDRMAALQNMASGRSSRDREWALQRLAQLSLAGVEVADVLVSTVSEVSSDG